MSSDDILQTVYDDYRTGLSDLTFNSKPIITNLTIIAAEQSKFAKMIVRAIEHHLDSVNPSMKLPAFYLLDSICKNNGPIYVSMFQPRIDSIFMKTYTTVSQEIQKSLIRVLTTWYNTPSGKPLFSRDSLESIKADLNSYNNPRSYNGSIKPHQNPRPFKVHQNLPNASLPHSNLPKSSSQPKIQNLIKQKGIPQSQLLKIQNQLQGFDTSESHNSVDTSTTNLKNSLKDQPLNSPSNSKLSKNTITPNANEKPPLKRPFLDPSKPKKSLKSDKSLNSHSRPQLFSSNNQKNLKKMAYIPRQNNRPPKFSARNNNPTKNFDEPKSNSYITNNNYNDQRNQMSIPRNNDPVPSPNINNRSEKKPEISSSNSYNYKDSNQPPPLNYNNNSNIINHSQNSANFNPTNQYTNNSDVIYNSSRPNTQRYSATNDYSNLPSSLNSSNFIPNSASTPNYNSPAVSENPHFSSIKNSAPSGYSIIDNNNNLNDAKNPINSLQLYPPLPNANPIPNINPITISNHLNNNLQHLFTNNIQNVNYNNKFPTHSALNQHIPPFNPNNFLIESLKASGLYQNITSIVPNFNNSDSQLNSFKPKIELIAFDSNSLKVNRPDAYKILFTDYPTYCSQCGWRTAESSNLESKPKMRAHLDWHFRNNRKLKENSRRRRPRGWFISQSLWLSEDSLSENSNLNHDISPFDSLSANKNNNANSSSNELNSISSNLNSQSGNSFNKSPNSNFNLEANSMSIGDENRLMLMQKTVAIPEGNTVTYCLVCKEPFKSIWNDSEEEWYYTNAVLKDGTIIHSTCAADMKNVLCSPYFLYIYTPHPPPLSPLFKNNLSTNLLFASHTLKRIPLDT
ncbi:hypothetical protein AYI69_g8029 [Smittium culicis]|uniref:CID domain-containing protein n=1 Tax=Smittium culicis TaxID=133412 RepID=A0A1R1XMR4_9FUNG|nr:hypothetical protein AYI69_g8029 [Smittium culicis]